jgi:hypothetical protein
VTNGTAEIEDMGELFEDFSSVKKFPDKNKGFFVPF